MESKPESLRFVEGLFAKEQPTQVRYEWCDDDFFAIINFSEVYFFVHFEQGDESRWSIRVNSNQRPDNEFLSIFAFRPNVKSIDPDDSVSGCHSLETANYILDHFKLIDVLQSEKQKRNQKTVDYRKSANELVAKYL